MALGLGSCDVSTLQDAVDDFSVVIGLESINTTSTVMLTDAATGELITRTVRIEFDGPNSDDVIDMYSDPVDRRQVSNGIFNLSIDNSVTPSESNPATIRLKLRADGYQTTTRTVEITREGSSSVSLKMMDENNPPSGVKTTVNSQGSAGQDGAVSETITVESSSDNNSDYSSTLNVPEGTVLKDANGNPVSGSLTTQLSYFDPSDMDALESLPMELEDSDGNIQVAVGSSSLRMTDGNGNITTISSEGSSENIDPMEVDFSIATDQINPETGNPYRPGDEVRIFLFDENNNPIAEGTSVIRSETAAAVNSGYTPNSYLIGAVVCIDLNADSRCNASDPSALNTGGSFSFNSNILLTSPSSPTSCGGTLTINRNGNTGSLTARLSATGSSKNVTFQAGESSKTISNLPNLNYDVEVPTSGGTATGSNNFCNQTNFTLDLPEPPPNNIDATVNVTAQCSNPDNKVRVTDIPGASVIYRKSNAPSGTSWKSASNLQWDYDEDRQILTGGSFDVESVEQGENYTFKTTYEDKQYTRNLVVDGQSVSYTETLDEGVCN